MSKRIRVAVLFGGKSGEHEVSLMSARSVMNAIDQEKYEVIPIGIDKSGQWLTSGDPMDTLRQLVEGDSPVSESPDLPALSETPGRALVPGVEKHGFPPVDVVFPVLHGPFGEDGTVQGLLELADVPYVGAGVTGSAVGMDKVLFKDVMRSQRLPIADYVVVMRHDLEQDAEQVTERVEKTLSYPVFTKPANLGSSVGIMKCHDRAQLQDGLADAARYDRKLLVEQAVDAAREIEISVLGNDNPIASVPGEIIPSREFYSYESKYLDSGDAASKLLIPAPLPPDVVSRAQALAVEAYRAIDCAGMARADFLLSATTGALYVNELNTIPGFTSISMYPKLWEASGLSYPDLIDRLIQLALERYADTRRSHTSYCPPQP